MFKPWIYFCLLAVAFGCVTALSLDYDDEGWYEDPKNEMQPEYPIETLYDSVETNDEKNIETSLENIDVNSKLDSDQPEESVEKVFAEIDKFINENIEHNKDISDNVNDYQIEDNRSNLEDDLQSDVADSDIDKDIDIAAKDSGEESDAAVLPPKDENFDEAKDDVKPDDAEEPLSVEEEDFENKNLEDSNDLAKDQYVEESIKDIQELLQAVNDDEKNGEDKIDDKVQDENVVEHAVEPLSPMETIILESDENKEIMEEVKSILNEDTSNNFENADVVETDDQPAEIVDEAKEIIENIDDAMDDDNNEEVADGSNEASIDDHGDNVDVEKVDEEKTDTSFEDEDTVDKAYEDLNAELDKLLATWDKIVNDESVSEEDDIADDVIESDEILDSEEDISNENSNEEQERVLDMNSDEKNNESAIKNDNDDWEAIEDASSEKSDDTNPIDILEYEAENNKPYNEESILKQREDLYENIDDSNLSEIFREQVKESSEVNEDDDDIEQDNNESVEKEGSIKSTTKQPTYVNDALMADDKNIESEANGDNISQELSDSQLDNLNEQFTKEHFDEIKQDIAKQSAPINLKLSLDEPTIVTSPNFPNNYPTNNVIDWVLDGEGQGVGIEFNITNFHVNGLLGDYVLVKPGEVDDTNDDGFVITHHLNSEQRYRFMDADKMFIRFQSHPGMAFRQGFRFSVKLIAPISMPEEVVEPEEPTIPPPTEYLNVMLGGVSVESFLIIQDEFRRLVADMATMYINANGINPGLNSTSEVTQITNITLCNINWPDFENCVAVRFGVPLQYEEVEDPRLSAVELKEMWHTYVDIDPFAVRLSGMGVTEFAIPDDGAVLMVWLVIAAGVVISMAMLAFALWRFSCFEGYTRMQSYSDTDSIHNMKRNLDLYPTPHQTLPPLYGESEYKWADDKYDDSTRVDMGGFTNKSYIRDDLFDIDSEEDVIPTRDRYTTDV